ncbi:serine hydrolase [Paenibacillus sp. YPG26]|uniref:serine hydrolase n=1 Tax=Paenibacillus sp. YPG26 TaxID=2878915 RepID=UPI00203F4870|nr:serine hydrolase [Paenibacillus sp. YPG26]USB33571.1 serine hydrolase [Paenibacillus sp. YPG26]
MTTYKRNKTRTAQVLLCAALVVSLVGVPVAAHAETAGPVPVAQAVSAKGPVDPAEVAAFADRFFARPEIAEQLTGAIAVIVKGDQIMLNKGYGYANIEMKKPIDTKTTLFRMASITKSITSTAVMQLAEKGKLDIHKDISAYMPDIPLKNETGTPVTAAHLMSHTTGFDFTDSVARVNPQKDGTIQLGDFIRGNAPSVIRKPGEAYRYDNIAFTMQGYIVQNITGEPFEEYLDKHIFKPLNMTHTSMKMTPEVTSNLATGYDQKRKPHPVYPNVPTIAPEGGMFSNGSDMANYIIAMLNGGKLGETRILEEKTVKEMQAVHYSAATDVPIASYGFESFMHAKHNGQLVIGKGGDLDGYHSWMWLLPDQKVGGLILTTSDATASVRDRFFAAFMDHYYPKQEAPKTYQNAAKAELARFEGIYRGLRTPLLFSKVTAEEGHLTVQDGTGTHTLRQISPLRFEDEKGVPAAFKEAADGGIAYLYYTSPDSMSEKLPAPDKYGDVPDSHTYADYIYQLRALGAFNDKGQTSFGPKQTISRGEFVSALARLAGLQASQTASAFADMKGRPDAAAVQAIAELGGITGTPEQRFEPDRAITRQEAAAIIARVARAALFFPQMSVNLKVKPAAWAQQDVELVVGMGLYGPETRPDAQGAVDYEPARPMLKQEAAAMLAQLLLKALSGVQN